MSKSIKLKDNNYWDSVSVAHKRKKLSDYLNKVDINSYISMSCYNSIGQNPDFNHYTKVGFYPFYDGKCYINAKEYKNVAWGCLIVIPYAYGNNTGEKGWYLQMVIGATSWDGGDSSMKFLCRRINYKDGETYWNTIL